MNEPSKTQVVTQKLRPESRQRLAASDASAILKDIGHNLVRVKAGADRRDKQNLKVVWHRSKLRTDIFSWENDDHVIHRQEMSFFGKVVEYREGSGLRTGSMPGESPFEDGDRPLVAPSDLFEPHRTPDMQTLEAACDILKACPDRDYFTQHLLKHASESLSELLKKPQTVVSNLDLFQALEDAVARESVETAAISNRPRGKWLALGIVSACVLIAGALFMLLWR